MSIWERMEDDKNKDGQEWEVVGGDKRQEVGRQMKEDAPTFELGVQSKLSRCRESWRKPTALVR